MVDPNLVYFSCGNGCNSVFQVVEKDESDNVFVNEQATGELLQKHLKNCTKQNLYKTDPNASIEPMLAGQSVSTPTPPATTVSGTDAYFRNSTANDTQIITNRTPLIVDGLFPTSFNRFDWSVWDAEQSKIIPSKIEESYIARVIFRTTSSSGSVITLDFDGGGSVGVIYEKTFQPTQLKEARNCETVTFFISPSIMQNGCQINVRASEETLITKASIYLRW